MISLSTTAFSISVQGLTDNWNVHRWFASKEFALRTCPNPLSGKDFCMWISCLTSPQCRTENHLIQEKMTSKCTFCLSAKSAQYANMSESTIVKQRCVSFGRNSAEVLWWIQIFFAPKITLFREPNWCIRLSIHSDRVTIHKCIEGKYHVAALPGRAQHCF